jgi:hypothetical protein
MIIQQVAATIFCIVLALTPLALWVAWSIPVMLLVIASSIVATIALACSRMQQYGIHTRTFS